MNNISGLIKENNNEWINILKLNEIASRQKLGLRSHPGFLIWSER